MLTDTHAHLDYPDFEEDFEQVLDRAVQAGVKRIITIGTSVESSRRAVALAEKHSMVYAVVGVHPTSADEAEEDILTPLRELAQNPRVVAIGETGLDYHRLPSGNMEMNKSPLSALTNEQPGDIEASIKDGAYKSAQAEIFQQQLDLAAELGLNVVIHQRDAWTDTLELLKPYSGKLRGVFHCFGGSPELAQEVFDLGHLISFTGIITFKNAKIVQETATVVPAGSFMVETDCPYLAPVPHRGGRCEPAYTRFVAEQIATLRNVSFETISEQTERTAEEFFRFTR